MTKQEGVHPEPVCDAARQAFELLVVHMSMYDSQGALNCERAVLAAFPNLALRSVDE